MSWSVAILSSRERPETLLGTIDATVAAAAMRTDTATTIDVIVNGNPPLAREIGAAVAGRAGPVIRVWSTRLGDKAHAWNEYVHRIWTPSRLTFFLDGYARIHPDALDLVERALAARPHALAGCGATSVGRSAARMKADARREGALYGNLFALRGEVMEYFRNSGFRLPLGIYRNDGLIGAVVNFNLDPSRYAWDPSRIVIEWNATWDQETLKPWRLKDLQTQYRRTLRQAQGTLENLAIRQHLAIDRAAPARLPRTAADLVRNWMRAHPADARRTFWRQPLSLVAARRLLAPRDWSAAELAPELMR